MKHIPLCAEFSVFKDTIDGGYFVELDGKTIAHEQTLEAVHKTVKRTAKEQGLKGAGVTEVFGRNRQFVVTPRFGYSRFKEEA